MSHTHSPSTDAAASRGARQLLRRVTANLSGRGDRGPDHAEGRRVPRRHSYEENTPQAQRWSRVGDGSVRQGIVYREALIDTARQLRHQQWKDFPFAAVRERRRLHIALTAELAELEARSPGEVRIGRPAVLRQEIGWLSAWLKRATARLRRIDVEVLDALLRPLDYATGKLIPTIDTIATVAGVHRNTVIGALRRLKLHGLIDWVRRTTRTGKAGEFGPQLEQTSNGYFFDHRRGMAPRTWQRYLQILTAKLRRLGAIPAAIAAAAREQLSTADVKDDQLRTALLGLDGALVQHAST